MGSRLDLRKASNSTTSHSVVDLDELLEKFFNLLITTGKELPFPQYDRRGLIEYARHYGLPTPLLDWSFSPYVALFFAFNGTRPLPVTKSNSVIYALNLNGLADLWVKFKRLHLAGYSKAYHEFLSNLAFFSKEFPAGELQFIDGPASWNVRMRRQMGSFLYDTVDWQGHGFNGLEDFIAKGIETTGPHDNTTLHKIFIPHSFGTEIFRELELSGVTGTHLYDDYSGAVADAVNQHNYNAKAPSFWNTFTKT